MRQKIPGLTAKEEKPEKSTRKCVYQLWRFKLAFVVLTFALLCAALVKKSNQGHHIVCSRKKWKNTVNRSV